MLGHRKTSLVQEHSRFAIDFLSVCASADDQISLKFFSRRFPKGGCDSQTLTSPLEYTTAFRIPARHGTSCCIFVTVLTLAHCSMGSTTEPYRPSSRGAHTCLTNS